MQKEIYNNCVIVLNKESDFGIKIEKTRRF